MKEEIYGLSIQEVKEKRRKGEGEHESESITKSKNQIIRENVLTLFNLLNFIIAGLLFAVGAYTNMIFIAIIILNIVIGIAQEFKAKKLVDELSILNRPSIKVRRGGEDRNIEQKDIVKGDTVILESGSQICNDSIVTQGMLEVNESLLTGESDPVIKEPGNTLYSGSSVISGKAYAEVIHVGNDNYATNLVNEVKKEKKVQSELLGSMRKVTRFTSTLIIPLGIILFLEAFVFRKAPANESVVASAAALLGMLPKGLVLLISVSLATGVIRLAKMKILVQNIYSLETLAHVDVLCLDKTGTITDGKLKVKYVISMDRDEEINLTEDEEKQLVQAYLEASDDNNATFQALKKAFAEKKSEEKNVEEKNIRYKEKYNDRTDKTYFVKNKISFSSKRKWGSISFIGKGTIFVGAPERILGTLPESLECELEHGRRLVAIGYYDGEWKDEEHLPAQIQPLYSVVLEDQIRRNAKKTLEFFHRQGVDVKVISGDHVKTVAMIAKRAGLRGWADAIDMSSVGEEPDYDAICREYTVFARVTPKQKQELVKAFQRQGHKVAMTGDGVNDLLALREADCSIAIADGSDASRQIAQVVLMDSDFTHLPQVVMEGRKVIHNVTRTAGVFFIKTIYSVLVSLFCVLSNMPFPFIPIQITLIDACIEAYPSFLTILESDTRRIKGKFLPTALWNAAPFGCVAALMIAVTNLFLPMASGEKQTVMYLTLIIISMTAVIRSCIPFNMLRGFICVTLIGGTFGALLILPGLFEISVMTVAMWVHFLIGSLTSVAGLLIILNLRGQQEEYKAHMHKKKIKREA